MSPQGRQRSIAASGRDAGRRVPHGWLLPPASLRPPRWSPSHDSHQRQPPPAWRRVYLANPNAAKPARMRTVGAAPVLAGWLQNSCSGAGLPPPSSPTQSSNVLHATPRAQAAGNERFGGGEPVMEGTTGVWGWGSQVVSSVRESLSAKLRRNEICRLVARRYHPIPSMTVNGQRDQPSSWSHAST